MREALQLVTVADYVAVVGSRYYPDLDRVKRLVGLLAEHATVVTGGAPGVDKTAEDAANERGLRCAIVRPSRGGLHFAADYFGRNEVIVRGGDIVVAFWDGESNGTWDSIGRAARAHIPCLICLPGKPAELA